MKKTLNFTKFTVIAIAIGFISPTISIEKNSSSTISTINISIINTLQAREDRNINRNKNKNVNKNKNSNKNTNVNVNSNRNKNTNVNVNVNNNRRRRGPSPIGILAGMAIGTVVVASTMSPSCTTVIVNGNSYRKCDGTYFQQQGTNYIVVKSPY